MVRSRILANICSMTGPSALRSPGDEEAGGTDERTDRLHPKANFCAPRDPSKAVGGDPGDGRRQITRAARSQYPEFVKNSYSPTTKAPTA